ncbi:hypothetical protein BC941DRAFT_4014 [Chlamydoabsidia padenii]|nr:hypothetical protein BC941DRAFT_4014 [Chlamydoabsidia padenii]
MQVKRGPTIPKKPHYLSTTDHELTNDTADIINDTLITDTSPPRQPDSTTSITTQTTTPLHNKQTYHMGGQKSNTRKPFYRRPKPVLTIQHLTLYSSSSPDNLLATKAHTSTASSSTHIGRQRASSSTQSQQQQNAKDPTVEPPKKPRQVKKLYL